MWADVKIVGKFVKMNLFVDTSLFASKLIETRTTPNNTRKRILYHGSATKPESTRDEIIRNETFLGRTQVSEGPNEICWRSRRRSSVRMQTCYDLSDWKDRSVLKTQSRENRGHRSMARRSSGRIGR